MTVKIDLSKNRDKDEEALEEPLSRAGFYTIAEAVEVVKREANVNIHEHLIEAVRSGALPTYEPNSTKRYIYGKDKRIRDFHEEVYWQDLNNWLEVNERLISYRFPDPNATKAPNQAESGVWTGVWTPKKLDELFDFHEHERVIKKNRAFKKATAERYELSTVRIGQLLEKREKIKGNKLGGLVNQQLNSLETKK